MSTDTVTPYNKEESKKEQVATMFDNISHKYDFLNHFFSLGIDIVWRNKAVKMLRKTGAKKVLDVATGTGDFAIQARKANPDKIVGIDISEGMLAIGKQKIKNKKLDDLIQLQYGDSEKIPFEDGAFDAVIVAFGVRNFENLEQGLKEIHRVIKKGGTAFVLEFSNPRKFPMKQLYQFYFRRIMPLIGKLVSKDNAAYAYLPQSVAVFPDGKEFNSILRKCGFDEVNDIRLTGGIASIYEVKK